MRSLLMERRPRALGIPPSGALDHKREPDSAEREMCLGWIVIAAFFGLFLGFAMFARIDAAAYAQGLVAVAGNRQTVQHRDGGTVSAIYVRDGQRVKAGQLLLSLSPTDVEAEERSLFSQLVSLQAERARLMAERIGAPAIAAPAEFARLTGADADIARDAFALQQSEFEARRRARADERAVLSQRSAQLSERIGGLRKQMSTNQRQDQLYADELKGMRELQAKGFASINRVRALERAQVSVQGETANLAASAASAREQIGEVQSQALSLVSIDRQKISEELRTVEMSLGDMLPKWRAAAERLAKTRVRAPATGQIVGLQVFTVGGVVSPGQQLMDIVPDAAPLVVEARISPEDADDLYVGQKTEVRITALHERDIPILEGSISRLSADSFQDEQTGARFFTAEITVPPSDLAEIKKIKAVGDGLKPGIPAEVIVPLRKRTLLQYLVEPLNQALWRSLREH